MIECTTPILGERALFKSYRKPVSGTHMNKEIAYQSFLPFATV